MYLAIRHPPFLKGWPSMMVFLQWALVSGHCQTHGSWVIRRIGNSAEAVPSILYILKKIFRKWNSGKRRLNCSLKEESESKSKDRPDKKFTDSALFEKTDSPQPACVAWLPLSQRSGSVINKVGTLPAICNVQKLSEDLQNYNHPGFLSWMLKGKTVWDQSSIFQEIWLVPELQYVSRWNNPSLEWGSVRSRLQRLDSCFGGFLFHPESFFQNLL